MVILSPIDFKFSFPFNLIVNAGQNKFEVDILKICGQNIKFKAQNRPDTTFEPGH